MARRVVDSVGSGFYDYELALKEVQRFPVLDKGTSMRVKELTDAFFEGLEMANRQGGFMDYQIPLLAPDGTDYWVSTAWSLFEPRSMEPAHNGWNCHRSHGVIVYAMRSSCLIELPVRRSEIRKGRLMYIPPGQRYRVAEAESDPFWIHFSAGVGLSSVGLKAVMPDMAMRRCLRELAEASSHRPSSDASIESKVRVMQVLLGLASACSGTPVRPGGGGAAAETVQRARELIENSVNRRLRLEDLSRATGVNIFTLSRRFTADMGVPPLAYHRSLKLREALRLLRGSPLSVKQVAARVGIDDPHYLSRLVKKHTGVSPKAIRGVRARSR